MHLVIGREEAKAKGFKFYFTGNPCKHGHVSERRVSNGNCIECAKQSIKKWVQDNIEHRKQYLKENAESLKQAQRKWYKDNIERARQYSKRRYQETVEMVAQRNAELYLKRRQELADSIGIALEDLPKHGYQKSRPGTFYVVKIKTIDQEFIGFGITSNLKIRLSHHRIACKKAGATLELLGTYSNSDGGLIANLESDIKATLSTVDTGIKGFRKEACIFTAENLQMIRDNMRICETELEAA